ncbi:MAG: 2TM domain-containing protein, partial [Methanothermobacter sp.]|nr:2TM domain-containing protein [Methanothermobacter sp.]
GVIWHAFGVFIGDRLLGKEWEERKIKEYMEKKKK